MVDWKAKATAAQDSLNHSYQKGKGPSSYSPSRYDPNAPVQPSISERRANSSVLTSQKEKIWTAPLAPPTRTTTPLASAAPPPKTTKPSFLSSNSFSESSPAIPTSRRPTPTGSSHSNPSCASSNPARSIPVTNFKTFSQFNASDKAELFNVLDEFFSSDSKPKTIYSNPTPSISSRPPPLIKSTSPLRSYPPPQPYSSSALSLLHYILYDTFETAWYESAMPPPLVGRNDIRLASSSSSRGNERCSNGIVVFGDCSVCWWKISWGGTKGVIREGRYRPIPAAWEGEELYQASLVYGSLLAEFAEKAVEIGRPVGRGECWDIANSALEFAATHQKPFPSIGRTHGFRIYYSRAGGVGEWQGGDQYVRVGDCVEWREVRISEVGGPVGSYSLLGSPDHTAVIIDVSPPHSLPVEGIDYPVKELNSFTVVEQSQGVLPKIVEYDLTTMTNGEIWIYRPVGLVDLLSTNLDPAFPPPSIGYEISHEQ